MRLSGQPWQSREYSGAGLRRSLAAVPDHPAAHHLDPVERRPPRLSQPPDSTPPPQLPVYAWGAANTSGGLQRLHRADRRTQRPLAPRRERSHHHRLRHREERPARRPAGGPQPGPKAGHRPRLGPPSGTAYRRPNAGRLRRRPPVRDPARRPAPPQASRTRLTTATCGGAHPPRKTHANCASPRFSSTTGVRSPAAPFATAITPPGRSRRCPEPNSEPAGWKRCPWPDRDRFVARGRCSPAVPRSNRPAGTSVCEFLRARVSASISPQPQAPVMSFQPRILCQPFTPVACYTRC